MGNEVARKPKEQHQSSDGILGLKMFISVGPPTEMTSSGDMCAFFYMCWEGKCCNFLSDPFESFFAFFFPKFLFCFVTFLDLQFIRCDSDTPQESL